MNVTEAIHLIKQQDLKVRVRAAEEIWDSIEDDPDSSASPAWHFILVKERLKDFQETTSQGESWKTVKQQLLNG